MGFELNINSLNLVTVPEAVVGVQAVSFGDPGRDGVWRLEVGHSRSAAAACFDNVEEPRFREVIAQVDVRILELNIPFFE